MNFAENLLRHDGDQPALLSVWENGAEQALSHSELRDAVGRFRAFLVERGVGVGDRVAAFMPNRPEAVIGMLAAASLGAVWSSCSPDFGFSGVMDRFGQIQPKVLLAADGYRYNGKAFSCCERVQEVASAIASIETVVLVPLLGEGTVEGAILFPDALNREPQLAFEQLPFDHPLYILYSSGTTGVPKCIVHGAGGTLIQHAKELLLHSDLKPQDRLFYFTTCGWMMWNWLVSGLLSGAAVVLYEGSPAHPDLGTLWRMAAKHKLTHFGTSPKFLTACAKAGVVPSEQDLSSLRVVLSTGAPLSVENFEWVYENVGPVQLASICGGTDIVSCFMLGSPIDPVYAGEIQKRGLGMDVQAWDEGGQPVIGEKGELVCVTPFPSMPVGFYNDDDGSRYRAAYFETYPGVWRHGDFVEVTQRGGVVVYGRSDATLNPGGVRIGTAEIYRQVERLDEVVDSIVVGQRFRDDTRVVLFVVLREGESFTAELARRIRRQVRQNCTPRHVPSVIREAPAVPRTISGKKVELAVTRLIHGNKVANADALANPDSLSFYREVEL
jgi:acetoacetyl-CoA synthetase